MSFKKFFYKKVNSTNDLAIKKLKQEFPKVLLLPIIKKRVEVNMEKNGYL